MKEESISLLQLKSVITLDYVYIFCAIYLLIFGILTIVDRKNPKRIGTAVFWIVYAITFYGCDHLAKLTGLAAGEIAGWLVILMAVIVATKQLGKGEYKEAAPAAKLAAATRLGNLLFIPVLGVGVLTFFIAWPRITDLGALIGFGVAALLSLLLVFLITRGSPLQSFHEGRRLLDVHHNFLQQAEIGGETGWLHRKGATPSDCGLVLIPGSRGDYSYLVEPVADCSIALNSLAHGAGRKWQRGECKGRLSHKYSADSLRRTAFGSIVVCADKALVYEEAPQAYKNIDSIIEAMRQAGLIEPIARLKPVLTYKTSGGCGE